MSVSGNVTKHFVIECDALQEIKGRCGVEALEAVLMFGDENEEKSTNARR